MSELLMQPVVEGKHRAWGAATVGPATAWTILLPDALLEDLSRHLDQDSGYEMLRPTLADRGRWEDWFRRVSWELEQGRGFCLLDRLPLERLGLERAKRMYWLLAQFVGDPFAQNVEGVLIYDVKDTGQDVASGARFSVTNYESSYHTDNSFGDQVLDYVGLLCLSRAVEGGVSQQVSGYSVYQVLQREYPEVLQILCGMFEVDRRGGVRPGEPATVSRPVFAGGGDELLIRYLRYWIEAGHLKAGKPLTADQSEALDILDAVLNRPELRVEFVLQPGQIYLLNNRWTLHNRTAFTDAAEPERRRHLVRLWLRRGTRVPAVLPPVGQ